MTHHPFIQHLEKDHHKQRQIGQQLMNAKEPRERETLRQKFYDELYPHVTGEEASIFDYMKSNEGEPREEALKAIQEHHVARLVLREIMDLSVNNDTFPAKAYVLYELNKHHMNEEEQTQFPMLERMTSKEQIDELYAQYKKAEAKAKSK